MRRLLWLALIVVLAWLAGDFLGSTYLKYREADPHSLGLFAGRQSWLYAHIAGGTLTIVRKRGLEALLTRLRSGQMSTTCRSSAKPTRQVVPSPGSIEAVRWLMRTMVPTTVLRCLSSKATFSPQQKSLRPARGGGGGSGGAAGLAVPGAGGSTAV